MERPAHLVVGLVKKPHGLQGEVLVYPATDEPETVFVPGRVLAVLERDGSATGREIVIERARAYQRAWLLRLEGVGTREPIDGLREKYLGLRTEEHPVRLPDGRTVKGRTWGWRAQPCPFTDAPEPVATRMAAAGADFRHRVGNAEMIVFRLRDCRPVIEELLLNGWRGHPPCNRCPIRPRTSPWTVPSDWDTARDALRPDSAALSY